MYLQIVSPEATLFSGAVTSVTVPGVDGEFQMLNNHAAIVSVLVEGTIKIAAPSFATSTSFEQKYSKNADKYLLPIKSGTLEMNDNKIMILVD